MDIPLSFAMMVSVFRLVMPVQSEEIKIETHSVCGEDAVMRCTARLKSGVLYNSVNWYKVSEEPSQKLTGLLRKRLISPNGTVQRYLGLTREVDLSGNLLFLPNVTAQDTGIYRCFMAAPLGEHNQEGDIHLKVTGCVEHKENDTLYLVIAISLLMVALLMFIISYVCLRNMSLMNKTKLMKTPPLVKNWIYSPETDMLGSKTLHQLWV